MSAGFSGPRNRTSGESLSENAVATIWNWLVTRNDVSVGHDRKYNGRPLNEMLNLAESLSTVGRHGHKNEGNNSLGLTSPESRLGTLAGRISSSEDRVYVSEDTMWEAITGHSVNYKRVPRSEWLLLLGIASTKDQGILQGDLGRLVDQDKRSVPKRTDSLVKKGYIVKRTTLVRGTKTSKLWLKSFAPPLPKETADQNTEREEEMNLSHQTLAANLDPVPWHTRWTGESMDFHALATTIMATTKEWQVIRLQDLKAKLGVLGMRWQMKIVSKICRFLNSRGAIQYVAAKLENKVFKDCIRFNTDLTTKDWSMFLATGKRAAKPMKTALLGMAERADSDGQADVPQINGARLGKTPPWSIDDPLPQKLVKATQSFGVVGLTNPEIYALTLGPSFNRYISSMTTCMATSNVQPPHLQHIQLRSEHIRVGKVASYRYYVSSDAVLRGVNPLNGASTHHSDTTVCVHGFLPPSSKPRFASAYITISNICGLAKLKPSDGGLLKPRGRPKKPKLDVATERSERDAAVTTSDDQPARVGEDATPCQTMSHVITLHISSEVLGVAMRAGLSSQDGQNSASRIADSQILAEKSDSPIHSEELVHIIPNTTPSRIGRPPRGKSRGSARGRGRGRPPHAPVDSPSSKPWMCENCGGSWKNDIGLKYHLEKSQTSCNPQYTPAAHGSLRRGRKPSLFSSKAYKLLDEDSTYGSPDVPPSKRELGKPKQESSALGSTVDRTDMLVSEGFVDGQFQPKATHGHRDSSSPMAAVKSWKRSAASLGKPIKFSGPKTDQGLLCQSAANQRRQIPAIQSISRHEQRFSDVVVMGRTHGDSNVAKSPSTYRKVAPTQAIQNTPSAHSPADTGSIAQAKSKAAKAKLKDDRADLRHFIEKLLRVQNGVLLGGNLLWQQVSETWNTEHPETVAPNRDECHSAVKGLLKGGFIMEHWHVFRDSSGSFSKCQLLTLPGIDAFSPESLQLLDSVKNSQVATPSFIQSKLTKDSGSPESKTGRRGRRLLAKEVAVLHAPVYVAQVAAKKEQELGARERVKRGRTSDVRDDTEGTASISAKRQKQIRWALGWQSGSSTDLLDPSHAPPKTAPTVTIQFLQPNTYLEQDAPSASVTSIPHVDRPAGFQRRTTRIYGDTMESSITESFSPLRTLTSQNGSWECLDTQYFELAGGSFSLQGWMPDAKWFGWSSFAQAIDKRHAYLENKHVSMAKNTTSGYHHLISRIQACFELEISWEALFTESGHGSAGPHNIMINFSCMPTTMVAVSGYELAWPEEGQLTQKRPSIASPETDGSLSSSSDDEFELADIPQAAGNALMHSLNTRRPENNVLKAKRVKLATRALTSLSQSHLAVIGKEEGDLEAYVFDAKDELMAAFIAVRTLVGGVDKAIDWGLLMSIFPNAKLIHLRRFWDDARKQQGPYIANFTRAFQERLLTAIEQNEIPMIDFDRPQEYDWPKLVQWTLQIPGQEGFQIPRSRKLLNGRFSLESTKPSSEDWRERFFHVQASIFSRFEAVTSVPGVVSIERGSHTAKISARLTEMNIARSWIKSLCSMGDGKYTVQEIRDKFFTLAPGNKQRTSNLFKDAIELLTRQKIICKSKKPPLGGRPYRLNEGYVAALSKMAQNSKYDAAAAFKTKMDASFRQLEKMRIPYTISDGAMMALTNLNASGRIKLVATNLPNIPFGFEPGNYESRKYPKSYYHFGLEAVPSENYLYNHQISLLRITRQKGPPRGTREELPQWIDFFGEPNTQRWSEILGAFCFTMATRGCMDIEGICTALSPVLDEFEARLIVDWGKETGILTDFTDGIGLVVGEWWWLAVPWLRRVQD